MCDTVVIDGVLSFRLAGYVSYLATNRPPGAATKPKVPTGQAAKEEAARLKQELYRLCKGKDNGLKATDAETQQVLDLADRLGKLNQVGADLTGFIKGFGLK